MATARLTVGAIFDTVAGTANTLTKTVGLVNDIVGMGSSFIESAAQDQRDALALHRETYRESLIQEKAMEIAELDRQAITYCNQSDTHKELYMNAKAKLSKVFDEKKPKLYAAE